MLAGADLNVRTSKGRSVLDVARESEELRSRDRLVVFDGPEVFAAFGWLGGLGLRLASASKGRPLKPH